MTNIKWISTRYKLRLKVKLDWNKYKNGSLTLPPKDAGVCKDWRFEIATDEKSAVFLGTWERRMLKPGFNMNKINEDIQPYTLSLS
uniref:Uncharacterized protein n=1 Tax=viral metagenome TaxID=1070528 RepID=A0A6C0LW14_9ZZZZ